AEAWWGEGVVGAETGKPPQRMGKGLDADADGFDRGRSLEDRAGDAGFMGGKRRRQPADAAAYDQDFQRRLPARSGDFDMNRETASGHNRLPERVQKPSVASGPRPESPMPKLDRVLETALYVDDLDRAARFYREVLELRALFGDDRLPAFAVLDPT